MSQLLASPPQARPSRRLAAPLARATAPVAALALLLLLPRTASADPLYEACLQVVGDLADQCLSASDSITGDLACMWAGGVGIIVCAILEAIQRLIPSGGIGY